MKKIDKLIKKVKDFFSYKKENRKLKAYVVVLEEKIDDLETTNENLQFEIDRDDKIQRIKYLEGRVEELLVQRRDFRSEIKSLKERRNKNEWNYSKIHRKA